MDDSSAFAIFLDPEEGGGDYRISNHGEEQRQHLIDRSVGDSLVVLADMVDVVHGKLSAQGDPASLMVMKFQFQPGANHRRFKAAKIKVAFTGVNSTDLGPAVHDIAPDGAFSLLPSKKTVEVTNKGSLGAQGGVPGATINTGIEYQLKESSEKENAARLISSIRLLGRDYGPKNTVIWTLLENPDTKSGIPTLLQAAILLKRNKTSTDIGEKFQATVEVEAEVDWKSSLQESIHKVVGKTKKDDAVLFNPALLARGKTWDLENLEAEDLEALQKVISLTKVKE